MKNLLFVDEDSRVLAALQRQLHHMRDEWQMNFVQSSSEALTYLAAHPVDLIVTDLTMAGMNGAQLLTEVRDRYPDTVRMVLSGQTDRESVFKLIGAAHQYLCKPCDSTELRETIRRALALRDLFADEKLKKLVTRIHSLPTLPTLHEQLNAELRKPDPSIDNMCRIISRDPGMVAKILQLVNSAFFGLPQPMSRIDEAVVYLGSTTVRDLVLSLQIFSQFESKAGVHLSLEELSQHCWITGNLAAKIAHAQGCSKKFADECFLAGLLHDLGQLILIANLPEQYRRVLDVMHQSKLPLQQVEMAEFGVSHAEIGGYLLALWGFSPTVVETVAYHHRPASCYHREFSPVIAVNVANAFAHDLANDHAARPGNQLDLDCLKELNLDSCLENWRTACNHGQPINS